MEPHDLNPYIDILVDELLELSSSTLFDAFQKVPFKAKVEILLHILDYPGICKVMSVVGSGGINGCMFCDLKGSIEVYRVQEHVLVDEIATSRSHHPNST